MAVASAWPAGGGAEAAPASMQAKEKQVTSAPKGHILTNTGVWSPDSQWIVYDTRSDPAGELFDGQTIEMVHGLTGEVRELYRSKNGAHCGVATFHPQEPKVVFIVGPENPEPGWEYSAWHRQGVIVDTTRPGNAVNLDARDLVPPFTPGALRGGSHLHVWDPHGECVSFTYEDHVLARFNKETAEHEMNLRNVGVSFPGIPVKVGRDHPRNHDGTHLSVLVTRTTAHPRPGSDEISRAFEEGWVGTNGYRKVDGTWQGRALAFQGMVRGGDGALFAEVFIVDLPEDLTRAAERPLAGSATTRPSPPADTRQRRLTFSEQRKFPGIQGPRHWLRSSPDGERIAFLMKDDRGLAQIWTVSPRGGDPRQLTSNDSPIGSAFTWSPDGRHIAHTMDNSVCVTDTRSGRTLRLTSRSDEASAPRPEACVFSPDGRKIAFVRRLEARGGTHNQVCVLELPAL